MAIYNEILSARFPKLAQKLFSMKGEQAVKQLTGELALVQNLPFGVEHRWLMSEDRYGVAQNNLGAAGQFVAYRFRNPSNSAIAAIFEKITITIVTAQQITMDLSVVTSLGDFGTLMTSQRIDGRTGTRTSAMNNTVTSTKAIAIAASIWEASFPTNSVYDLITTENQELTVLPGDALTIGNTTAATTLGVAAFWRERPLEESERQ